MLDRHESWGKFGSKSYFFRIYLTIMATVLLMAAIFCISLSGSIASAYRNQILHEREAWLIKAVENLELSLTSCGQRMTALLWEKQVSNAILAPGEDEADMENQYAAVTLLSDWAAEDDLVSQCFLYIPYNDMVLAPDGTITVKDEFQEKKLIDGYLQWPRSLVHETERSRVYLLLLEGRLFLCEDFPHLARLATLYVELDQRLAAEFFGAERSASLSVSDASDRIIFSLRQETADQYTITQVSERTGWTYRYHLPQSELRISGSVLLRQVLQALLILLALGLLSSLFLADRLYRPIYRLTAAMPQPPAEKDWQGNELDMLADSFDRMQSKQETLAGILGKVTPEAISQVLSAAVIGELAPGELERLCRELGQEKLAQSRFLLLLCRPLGSEDQPEVERQLWLLQATRSILTSLETYTPVYPVECGLPVTQALVCAVEPNHSQEECQHLVERLRSQLADSGQVLLRRTVIGEAPLCVSGLDLTKALRQAQEDLNYRLYYAETQDVIRGDSRNVDRYLQRWRTITEKIDQAGESGVEAARQLAQDVLSLPPELSTPLRQRLSDEILSQLIVLHLADQLDGVSGFEAQLTTAATLIESECQRKQFRHVRLAKEYIEQHYMDNNLSLEQVGVFIGLHPSYLSKLFAEQTGEKFLEYVNRYRVQQAQQLLRNTEYSISDIGYRTGFSSASNFIRVFKKHTSQTPGSFRGQEQGGEDA